MEQAQPPAASTPGDDPQARLMLVALQQHQAGRLEEAGRLYRQVVEAAPAHAGALGLLGLLAQQQGDLASALALLQRAVEAQPAQAVFRLTLAHLLVEMGRPEEAATACRAALEREPGSYEAWFHLGRLHLAQWQPAQAVTCLQHAAALRPEAVDAWCELGLAQMALEDWPAAQESLQQGLQLQPGNAALLNHLGVVLRNRGALAGASACFNRVLGQDSRNALALFNMGTLHFNQRDWAQASHYYHAALGAEPDLVEAHQNLAGIYLDAGRLDEAAHHRECAYRRQAVFIERALQPKHTVLVLWAAGKGNIPIDHLLPRRTVTRIICFIEYLTPEQEAALPAYDYVFNAIGDIDVTGPTEGPAAAFLARCGRPVLNRPEAVARTGRDAVASLLGGTGSLVVPMAVAFDTATLLRDLPGTPGLAFPVIVRPANSHGGDHLVKLDDAAALRKLQPFPSTRYYATAYVDSRSADGFYRKYRVVFVDRLPYAYHLAIGSHWIVHYGSTGMQEHAWKRDEESRFLADPAGVLGPPAWAALQAVGRALDLDYGGIDFSLLPDGRPLLFEANATMLAHPEEPDSVLAYKNPHVERIYEAFNALAMRKMAGKEKGA